MLRVFEAVVRLIFRFFVCFALSSLISVPFFFRRLHVLSFSKTKQQLACCGSSFIGKGRSGREVIGRDGGAPIFVGEVVHEEVVKVFHRNHFPSAAVQVHIPARRADASCHRGLALRACAKQVAVRLRATAADRP